MLAGGRASQRQDGRHSVRLCSGWGPVCSILRSGQSWPSDEKVGGSHDADGFPPMQRQQLRCGTRGRAGLLRSRRAPGCRAERDWPAFFPGDLDGPGAVIIGVLWGGHIGGGVEPLASPPFLLFLLRSQRPILPSLENTAFT
ncbi:hypothetical protein NDU88_007470 [Pleurodeles waltl]|uniref:Uncharacterized protein n=1 Tax=Pleurodeles waltl TaxID=8319 RepID=A0AAV7U047_PLEWA|nr:hypothetical protein NDU88_007470 [Pleurodeles waltl]